jgi:hypothetical protein
MSRMRAALQYLGSKHLENWVGSYFLQRLSRLGQLAPSGRRHLLFAVCDHYEPLWAHDGRWQTVPHEVGVARVARWEDGYPRLARRYRDADGYQPRHSFFFPLEQYHEDFLEPLARLARLGLGEVEVHLHHDGDDEQSLRSQIDEGLQLLAQHGHLSRAESGLLQYAFIHGDWALANGRPDGQACGVDAELPLLFDSGCYADFTFPAAPSACQPGIINQIYWPTGDLRRRRAYDKGERARVGVRKRDRILMIQGPLALTVRTRGIPLQIENSDITGHFPAASSRVHTWVSQNIHVVGRPEWVFVKVHTHGAPQDTADSLLGSGGEALHRILADSYNDGEQWQLHYVTAREMYNIAVAAMDGRSGRPGDYRDYVLAPPPVTTSA